MENTTNTFANNPANNLIVVDVGNTILHWGIVNDAKVSEGGRLVHADAGELGGLLTAAGFGRTPVVVASVNPRPLAELDRGLEEAEGQKSLRLEANVNWFPEARVDRPAQVGIDRLVNARAMRDLHPEGGIIVDHGTALTIDYVEPGGIYAGGAIVPGIAMSTQSLAAKTALIPEIEFEAPGSVVGTTTQACIRSGLYYGYVGLVEALVKRIRAEKGADLPVVVTGGDSAFLADEATESWEHRPLLTLAGVAAAAFDANLT